MAWFKLDEGLWSDPKITEISNDALALHICGVSYSAQYATSGTLTSAVVERIARFRQIATSVSDELVNAQLWERIEGGYRIRDWGKFRPITPASERHPVRSAWEAMASAFRPIIFRRDEYRCRLCGSSEDLEVDHIIPIARGGLNRSDNLQTLCRTCNRSKGAS